MTAPIQFSNPALSSDVTPTKESAAKQLEAFFLRRMLAEMRKTVGESSLTGGYSGQMFQEMLDEALADQMSESGGLGIAEMMSRHLDLMPSGPTASVAVGASGVQLASRYASQGSPLEQMPVQARVSSEFGKRVHPVTGQLRHHEGIDLAALQGSPVAASGAGVVVRAEMAGTYGNLVVVDHGGGLETRYAHLDSLKVHVGDQVLAGEQVGTVGKTGRATGPHLHFEVRRDGKAVDPQGEMRLWKKNEAVSKDSQKAVDQ